MRRVNGTEEFPGAMKDSGGERSGKEERAGPAEEVSSPKKARLGQECEVTPGQPENRREQRSGKNVIDEGPVPEADTQEIFGMRSVFQSHEHDKRSDEADRQRLDRA